MSTANPTPLDASSHVPLYVQLRDRLRGMIASGDLRHGDRLAPTRSLAQEMGVNRTTVEAAYAELEAEGLVVGHVGRGTFVASDSRAEARTAREARPTPQFPWSGFLPENQQDQLDAQFDAMIRSAAEPGVVSFAAAHPPDVVSIAGFRRACDRVLRNRSSVALKPGPVGGYSPLREWLSERLSVRADDITITNGCQQSLDLLAKAFVQPGQAVVIENPVYPGALMPFRQAGARILGLPVTPDGADPAVLERLLETQRVRLIVVTPNYQNPTGATMPADSRRRILEIAQRFQVPLVENDSYGWLSFARQPLPSLKTMDRAGSVICLGSFSKAGFPGLRLGWCVAPQEATARLRRAKQATDLHTDQFVQAVMVEFARGRALDRAVGAVRDICRRNSAMLAQEITRHFPDGVMWRPPQGGMAAWFQLPSGITADAVLARARQHRVVFTPGRFFYFQDSRPETFRLSFGSVKRNDIARGVKVIGEAIRAEMKAGRTRRTTSRQEARWALV